MISFSNKLVVRLFLTECFDLPHEPSWIQGVDPRL